MMEDLFEAPDGEGEEPQPKAEKPKKKARKAKAKPAPEKAEESGQGSVEAQTELIVAEAQADAVALFTDEKRYSEFYERIRSKVSGFEPDLSTPKGRAAIASLAFKVTKSKTALDKAGLQLTADWREKINAVNGARRKMVDELDELAKEVRKPLTEWEDAEKSRLADVESRIQAMRDKRVIEEGETSADLEARGRELHDCQLDPELFQERLEEAEEVKAETVRILAQAMHRMREAEAERAELARLRKAEEERLAREAEQAAQREREEAERKAKEEEEARQRREEEARQAAIREAEERARKEAEEAAEARRKAEEEEREAARQAEEEERERARKAEAEEREREHQAALEAERKEREAAQEQARKDREEFERKERERREEEERQRKEREAAEAEAARLAADKAHRQKIAGEAAKDMADVLGSAPLVDDDMEKIAQHLIRAIAAGEVRHCGIKF